MFRFCKTLYDSNILKINWIENIKQIFDKCGYSNVWYDKNINVKWLKASLHQKLEDIEKQSWLSEINSKSCCTTYRIFKTEFGYENYLNLYECKQRITLCKFRCGNHRLPINKGRFEKVDRNLRLCPLCDSKEIGDEFHYLFSCNFFQQKRILYINKYYRVRPNTIKMYSLINSNNRDLVKKLIKFIEIILVNFKN